MDETSNSSDTEVRDLNWYVSALDLDEAASRESHYTMSTALRDRLGYHIYEELPQEAPALAKAATSTGSARTLQQQNTA